MAIDIFLHMHGGWQPSLGFAYVPKGCSLTFWSPYAKLLPSSTARELLAGTWKGKPDRVIGEYKSVPNMILAPLTASELAGDVKARSSAAGRAYFSEPNYWRLGDVMDGYRKANTSDQLDFHWLCCQELILKDAGGGKYGVNAGDLRQKGFYQFMWKDETGVTQNKLVQVKGKHT